MPHGHSSKYRRARSGQVETHRLKELAQDQWLEHDLGAKVVSTFVDHALELSHAHCSAA